MDPSQRTNFEVTRDYLMNKLPDFSIPFLGENAGKTGSELSKGQKKIKKTLAEILELSVNCAPR